MVADALGRTAVRQDAAPGHEPRPVGPAAAPELELVVRHGLAPAIKPPPQLHPQLHGSSRGRFEMDDNDLVGTAGEKLPPVLDIPQPVGEPGNAVANIQAAPVIGGPFLVMAEVQQGQVAKSLVRGLGAWNAERAQFGEEMGSPAIAFEQRLADVAQTAQGERVDAGPKSAGSRGSLR